MDEGAETGEKRHYGLETGTVTDNADPKKLGRVKIRVPGVIDETEWAFPLATRGGGSPQRGAHEVPQVGADVAVWFHRGDPRGAAYYCSGHWGETASGSEAPGPIKDDTLTPEEAHRVAAYETDRWLVVHDDRAGKELLSLKDKVSGDRIELDGNRRSVTIRATAKLALSAALVDVRGAVVMINGRAVSPLGGPI